MFVVSSSAGLQEQAPTIELATVVLAQHLQAELPSDGPLHWRIITPRGVEHLGHLNLNGATETRSTLISSAIDRITGNLIADAAAGMLASSTGSAVGGPNREERGR